MVQMLKQGVNKPLPVYKQAAIIFAGNNGYFDDLQLNQIATYESLLFEKLDTKYLTYIDQLISEEKMSEESTNTLHAIAKETLEELLSESK